MYVLASRVGGVFSLEGTDLWSPIIQAQEGQGYLTS